MTRASLSPSSVIAPPGHRVAAGPLDITLVAPDAPLMEVVATALAVYDLAWTLRPMKKVALECQLVGDAARSPARGSYLQAARMLVDLTPAGMHATTEHGAEIEGSFSDDGERWYMHVPRDVIERRFLWEIEDLLSLVLTTGWRRAGWVPLHAAGLTDGRRGVIVCATGGGGKTTFTMAMARAGWKSLGDDKLLLRSDGEGPLIGALKHMLNIDPAVDAWFPEVGDLRGLPEYSASTVKRRVSLESLWSGSTADSMRPTTIISLERRPERTGFSLENMDAAATIATLLRQTVIPTDPEQARWITRELATCARGAVGLRVTVGEDAYVDPSAIAQVALAIR